MRRSNAEIGSAGESFASQHLIAAGYAIVARNWRVQGGEIDIIALDGDSLVFAEVRARADRAPVIAEATVDNRKLARIMLAADAFLQAHDDYHDRVWRVDLIAIAMDSAGSVRWFRHYENLTLD